MQVKNDELRRRIIETARQCFFEMGYKKTLISTIAQRGYTTSPNIYTYFDNKLALFNEVIGDVPLTIDTYIETYYRKAIHQYKDSLNSTNLHTLFPKELIFNKTVSMTLYILLECSEGTPYASYKKDLYTLLKDCTQNELKNQVNSQTVYLVINHFINSVLSVSSNLNTDRDSRLNNELYYFHHQPEDKTLTLKILGWKDNLSKKEWDDFWKEYQEVLSGFIPSEYTYIIDCQGMPTVFDSDVMRITMNYYYISQFKARKYLFKHDQIALSIVCKRLAQEIGDTEAEIIFND